MNKEGQNTPNFYSPFFAMPNDEEEIVSNFNDQDFNNIEIEVKKSQNLSEFEVQILVKKISEKMLKLLEAQLSEIKTNTPTSQEKE